MKTIKHQSSWLNILMSHGVEKSFSNGNSIFFQDDELDKIGYVVSGQLDAWVHSVDGLRTWVDSFQGTDFFGHVSLLTQSPIQYDVIASNDVKVVFIPIHKVQNMLEESSDLSHEFSLDLAMRLEVMTNRLIEAVMLSAKGRVCAELLRLSKPIGINPGKLIIRPLPVFVELAARINSTRETVSRTVSDLQKEGVLSREPGSILIHNPEALEARKR